MLNQKKNDCLSLTLRISSDKNDSYSASLTTEAEFKVETNQLIIVEKASSFIDLRARWNTIMRGLIASEHVLKSVEDGY
jgi:tRNA threonylcarbamoyladenosine modification (KEOPS) complex  Pcc1 subunit